MSERREFFTAQGGYVLMQQAHEVAGTEHHLMNGSGELVAHLSQPGQQCPRLFACTAGDNDLGVDLEDGEVLQLGLWLLDQLMDPWEREQVHRTLQLTRQRLGLDPDPAEYAQLPDLDPEPF